MAEEKTNVTGLDSATNRKDAEYDLVQSLLEAAEFKTAEDNITDVNIKRNGKLLFTVGVRPISDPDTKFARKKATTYMPNPNNKKLPPIEKDFDNTLFTSWIIYLATTEEDRDRIWGNPSLMKAKGIDKPVDSIDILLTLGEKRALFSKIYEISGMDEDGEPKEDENMDEEEFAKN